MLEEKAQQSLRQEKKRKNSRYWSSFLIPDHPHARTLPTPASVLGRGKVGKVGKGLQCAETESKRQLVELLIFSLHQTLYS